MQSSYLPEPAALMAVFSFAIVAGAPMLWFVGVSRFFTVPASRQGFLRAGRRIMRATGLVFIGRGLRLATERMHG
ncbi:hypothetical protein [Aureimonas populi]|uniref:LysE family translocator n=1 Tax=Aureimonas populi TaxID=1701758 RepID=A0ABW5CQV7_9HYPH|nr:hypothetical protein [Aureimonas populi]